MQHDVPVIKSISFFGTVTSGDAAAVACLNVITRMKGRILIKTISPTHLLPSPLFKSWAGGCVGFFFNMYALFFLLRNISNRQAVAYYIMSVSSPLLPTGFCWGLAKGCAEWGNYMHVASSGGLAVCKYKQKVLVLYPNGAMAFLAYCGAWSLLWWITVCIPVMPRGKFVKQLVGTGSRGRPKSLPWSQMPQKHCLICV